MSTKKTIRLMPIILMVCGAILIGGVIMISLMNTPSQIETGFGGTLDSTIPHPEVPRVSLRDAKAAFDNKAAVFVDVRGEDSYADGHIPSAMLIPEYELQERKKELQPSAWIITYCS